ncbi:MAG: hypothetical protein HYV28_04065 [Ignavibacteriales bacterium]|nr:hypothetical protein [Ignavibacteriales bacterium]
MAIPFDTYVVSSFVQQDTPIHAGSWLGLIEADEEAIIENTLDYETYKKSSIISLEEMIGRYNIIEPFTTMNDGGNFVDALYKVTGKEHFRNILGHVLNP